jgi:hypothetical protein
MRLFHTTNVSTNIGLGKPKLQASLMWIAKHGLVLANGILSELRPSKIFIRQL